MSVTAEDILSVIMPITKAWTKQRKAEERGRRSRTSRKHIYSERVNFTEVAHDILHAGYAHASGNGRYTLDKRQFYYAVRDEFLEKTGREIKANYFSQMLLVKYMNQHPQETSAWKITASPRGTLTIPNGRSDIRIPCGTTAIEQHLRLANRQSDAFADLNNVGVSVEWPSKAEGQRYQGVLYIEKEGFDPQLREAQIAERFDLAIISCKGQSVTAARMYVDHACRKLGGVPLFVVHDFDKAGFEIAQRLTSNSQWAEDNDLVKYRFQNSINVTDLGLRLVDVNRYGLKSERVRFKGRFSSDTYATKDEQEFLRSNRRVELNAFTAPHFIEWIESGLTKYGLGQRLIPDDAVLTNAYRRAWAAAHINQAIDDARTAAIDRARSVTVPMALRRQLRKILEKDPQPWDQALYQLVNKTIQQSGIHR